MELLCGDIAAMGCFYETTITPAFKNYSGEPVSNIFNLKVKRTNVLRKLSSAKLTGESGEVNLRCSTKGCT